tara:strand:- start:267 stop:602 length:336 start_codon:yes stop_codon:yes gene_type:complete
MKKLEIISIDKNSTLESAMLLIKLNGLKTVCVLNKDKVVGILDVEDIIDALLKKKSFNLKVENIMNKSFKYLTSYNKNELIKLFKKFNLTIVPIVNKRMQLKKIVHIRDIL